MNNSRHAIRAWKILTFIVKYKMRCNNEEGAENVM
jgi:hypothetical protein